MKKIATIAVCAFALALTAALAGCGSAGSTASSSSAQDSSSAASAADSSAASAEESATASAADSSTEASASSSAQTQSATVKINTEGMGQIAWAYEGETPEFDKDYPIQSAVVNGAYGQKIAIAADEDPSVKGFVFSKWTLDGKDFSTDKQIEVLVDKDAEYIAVFDAK